MKKVYIKTLTQQLTFYINFIKQNCSLDKHRQNMWVLLRPLKIVGNLFP